MADQDDAVRLALDRLYDDEALRGSLTDAGFEPLLDWGSLAIKAQAGRDPAAIDAYAETVRGVIEAAVAAAEAGTIAEPAALLTFATQRYLPAFRQLTRLSLGPDPDANAQAIATVLHEALLPRHRGEA
jgi:hypothetical protein